MTDAPLCPVAVTEVPTPPLSTIRLRRPSKEDIERIGVLIGTRLPLEPNRATDGAVRAIWIGLNEWLIVGDTAPAEVIEGAAQDAAAALCVSVADGRCMFEVTGQNAADLMAKGTSLDVHAALGLTGTSAMTLFAQGNVIIDRPPGLDGYRLTFDVSIRNYLRHWFADAVVEFG